MGNVNMNAYTAISTDDTFTLTNTIAFGTAQVTIDRTGKIGFPIVTGATLIDDIAFSAGAFWMYLEEFDGTVYYFFRQR